MKHKRWTLFLGFPILLVLIALAGWLLGTSLLNPSDAEPSSPVAAMQPPAPAPVDLPASLAADLASPDAALQARAQAQLAAATCDQLPRLKQLAGGAPSSPVVALLQKRIEALEEQAAIDPLPISLSLRDASTASLAAALTKALGKPFDFYPPGSNGGPTFTLDAQNQPFWNVINDINHEHAVAIDRGVLPGRQIGLILRMDRPMPELHPEHGFVVFGNPSGAPIIMGAPPPAADEFTLNYTIAADPRIWVTTLAFGPHDLTVDGTPMTALKYNNGLIQFQAHDNLWNTTITVRLSDKFAGKTALIRARHTFTLVSRQETLVIQDPEKHLNETFQVGLANLTLSPRSSFSAGRVTYTLTTGDHDTRADIDLFDATGTLIHHDNYFQNNGRTVSGTFQPPFKLQITAPAKIKDVVVPVDLPYPLP